MTDAGGRTSHINSASNEPLSTGKPADELVFSMLFEHMLNGVAYCKMVFDGYRPSDFIYLYTNPAFHLQTGLGDVAGRQVSEVIPGIHERDGHVLATFGRVSLSGKPETFEIYLETLKQWYAVSAYCPQPGHFVSIFEVITERKQKERELQDSERRLRESEASFRSMFENNHSIMLLVDAQTGDVVDANAAALRFYGYGDAQIKTMNVCDINTATQKEISQALSGALHRERHSFVFNHRLCDGEIRTVEVRSSPIMSGGRQLLFSIINDISARQQAEDAIRNSEERLRRAELAAKTGNWELHLDSKLVTASAGAALIYGVDQDCLDLELIQNIALPEYRPMLDKALAELTVGDMPYDVEFKIRTVDRGELKDVHSRATLDRERRILFGVIQDITEQKAHEHALRESERRYRLLAENCHDVIWTVALPEGRFTYISPSVERLRGYTAEEVMTQPVEQALTAESALIVKNAMSEMLARIAAGERTHLTNVREVDQPHRDGRIVHTEVVTTYILNEAGHPESMLGVTRDITQRKQAERELERLAQLDVLTGLANRRHFMFLATQELTRTYRYGGTFTVLMMDIDHFKSVNDTYGHQGGDTALQKVGEVFRECLRDIDCVGRIGGEEFAAVLPQTDISRATDVAERLRQLVESKEIQLAHGTLKLTLSIGITASTDGHSTLDVLLGQADRALYEAKHSGRNRVAVFR